MREGSRVGGKVAGGKMERVLDVANIQKEIVVWVSFKDESHSLMSTSVVFVFRLTVRILCSA